MSATTDTQATLSRLATADSPVPLSHLGEVEPWLAAATTGDFELPADVLAIVVQAEHLAAESATIVHPPQHQPADVHALLEGQTVEEILETDDLASAAISRRDRALSLVRSAEGLLVALARDAFAPHRDALVVGPLREAVAALLTRAREMADKLKAYAPDYGDNLLAGGSPAELKLWRDSRILNRDLDIFQQAWRASFSASGPDLHPQRPGGYFAWTDPQAVRVADLRLGHDREALRIAKEQGEYRLLSPSELEPLLAEMDRTLPRHSPTNARGMVRADVCS